MKLNLFSSPGQAGSTCQKQIFDIPEQGEIRSKFHSVISRLAFTILLENIIIAMMAYVTKPLC